MLMTLLGWLQPAGDGAPAEPDATGAAAGEGSGGDASGGGVLENLDPDRVWELVQTYAIPVVKVLVLLLVAWIVAGWLRRVATGALRRAKIEETLARFFGNLIKWAILIFALLAALEMFGVETTSFAAVIAGASLAIGLAFQGSLGNLAAGVMLLIFRPFKVGDYIEVSGESGTVKDIDLFTTYLDTPDNQRIIVPNGAIFGSTIQNVTYHPKRRCDVNVGTDYAADLDKTREVLMEVARSVEGRLPDEEPVVYLKELGGSSIDWAVRVWVQTGDYWAVRERLTRNIKVALDDAGIGIPFPQMDVHLNKIAD